MMGEASGPVMTSGAGGVTTDPRLAMLADHAGRAIARQAVKVDEHRARAATLFTAASVAGGFLGAESFKAPSGPGTWAWVGAVLYALAGCVLAYVMWPRRWSFNIDIGLELKEAKEESIDAVNQNMASTLWGMYEQNDQRLQRLTGALATMVILAVDTVWAFFVNVAVR